jgi:hypothetical protein
LPFSGPKASTVRSQLISELCNDADCVAPAKVASGAKPNWSKAKKEKVAYLLAGKVVKKRKKELLEVSVLKGPGRPKLKKRYPLTRGKLTGKNLTSATRALYAAMALDAPPKAPEPPPEVESEPEPVAEDKPSRDDHEEGDDERPTVASRDSGRSSSRSRSRDDDDGQMGSTISEPGPRPKSTSRHPLFTIEAGSDLVNRSFTYSQLTTENLRSYDAPLIVAPAVRLQVFPLSRTMDGILAGLGIEAGYSFAVGLRSTAPRAAAGGATARFTYPSSLTRFDIGAKLRAMPFSSSNAAIIPMVGFRSTSFSVAPAVEDGSLLDALPSLTHSGLNLGLGTEIPFADDFIVAFGHFKYLLSSYSGTVVRTGSTEAEPYFPNGSSSGIEVALGGGVRVTKNFEARLTAQFTQYNLAFQTQPTDLYITTGATDRFLGANLAIRYAF